jgi:protein SCO1/2
MQMKGTIRFLLAAAMLFPAASPLLAQVAPYGEKTMGDPAQDHLPDVLNTVKIDQRLGQQLPLDASFRDETGKAVKLGDYFGKKPVILSLVYYQCQILCMEDLNGLVGALEMVNLTPGKDFQIVIVSIDPAETPAIAAAKKAIYVKRYARPENSQQSRLWHRQSALVTCACRNPTANPRCLPTPARSRWLHRKDAWHSTTSG